MLNIDIHHFLALSIQTFGDSIKGGTFLPGDTSLCDGSGSQLSQYRLSPFCTKGDVAYGL